MFIGQQQEKEKPNYGFRTALGGTVGLAGLNQFGYARRMKKKVEGVDDWLKQNEKKVNTKEDLSTLGLKNKPDEKELKRAYRATAKRTHPDMLGGNAEQFTRVNDAYDNLKTGRTHTRSPELDKQYQSILNDKNINTTRKRMGAINTSGKIGLGLGALGVGYAGYNAYKYMNNNNAKKNQQR